MLSNNVIGSARGLYENQSGIWTSSRCWHFQAGSYIRHDITEEFIRNNTGDYTIAGWFYFPSVNIADYVPDSGSVMTFDNIIFGFSYQRPNSSFARFGYGPINLERNLLQSTGPQYRLKSLCDGGSEGNSIVNISYNLPDERWVFLVSRVKTSSTDDNVKIYCGRFGSFFEKRQNKNYNPISNISNFQFTLGGTKVSFYVSELGIWKDNLPDAEIESLYNDGSPVDFSSNYENYTSNSDLVAYYRFGNGSGDNPSSLLHDETNSANTASESDGDRDIGSSSIIGTLHQVETSSIGLNYE